MLALVTCHTCTPLNLIRKKWIPGTWLPGWQLAVFQSESTASRVRSGRCPRQCATLLHGKMYLQEKTPVLRFGHTLEQNSSICPIISYLWTVDLVMRFFPVGPTFEDHPQEFGQKKFQPLEFYFWHLRLGLFKSLFFGWWSWTYVVVPFCKDKCIFSKKHMFCNLGLLISWCLTYCTSGSFQEKNLGLFWYDIFFLAPYHAPGPSPTVC